MLRRLAVSLVASVLVAGYGPSASAVAVFSGNGSLSLSVAGITSTGGSGNTLTIVGSVFDDGFPFIDEFGTGVVSSASSSVVGPGGPLGLGDSVFLGAGNTVTVSLSGAGSALLPDGYAFFSSNPIFDIDLSNIGPDPDQVFTVDFAWSYTASTSGGPFPSGGFPVPPYEEAAMDIYASIYDSVNVPPELDVAHSSDGLFGPPAGSASGGFSIAIGPGGTEFVSLDLYGEGYADALDAPEPGTTMMVGLGLLGLMLGRRRRAAA